MAENETENMEVKRIVNGAEKPFIAQKTTTCYCSLNARSEVTNIVSKSAKWNCAICRKCTELRSSLEKGEYFTFSQAARLMGVSRQYIYKFGQGG